MKLTAPAGLRALAATAVIGLAAFASVFSTTAVTEARVLSDFWVQVLCDSPSASAADANCSFAGRNYECVRADNRYGDPTWNCEVN